MTATPTSPSPTPDANEATRDARKRPIVRPPLPDAHADVALADINDLRALIRMSASWIHEEVRHGRFPEPVIREPRCTRWRISDVRAWLIERANKATVERQSAPNSNVIAKSASTMAVPNRPADTKTTNQRAGAIMPPFMHALQTGSAGPISAKDERARDQTGQIATLSSTKAGDQAQVGGHCQVEAAAPDSAPVHPLLFGGCSCGKPGTACLLCARWGEHYRNLMARRKAWTGGPS